MRKVQKLKII